MKTRRIACVLALLGWVLLWPAPPSLLAQSQAVLQVSPSSLSFDAQAGGEHANPGFLSIANPGTRLLKWQASTDVAWITLGAPAGKLSGGQEIHLLALANTDGLNAGVRRGTIMIEDPDAQGSPAIVDVTLTLTDPPRLEVSPTSLSFSAEEGGSNPASKTLTIRNTGGQALSWTASENLDWLKLSRARGTLDAGESTQVTVTVDVSGLSAGLRQSQILILAIGAENSPVFVDVTLMVTGRSTRSTGPAPSGMVEVPGGSFQMGDSFNEVNPNARPTHTVEVSGFYMDKFEVTKGMWDEVADWASSHGYDIGPGDGSTDRSDGTGSASEHPVTFVSWYEVVKWANARSEMEGLVPVYYTSSTRSTVYRTGNVDVRNDWVKWEANGYRLPTEAEWEKAARGGMEGKRYSWGDEGPVCKVGVRNGVRFDDDDKCNGIGTAPVGTYLPNGYGLYDMAGNVWEWNWDGYGSYTSSSVSDPRGAASGSGRVNRGGGWRDLGARVAVRNVDGPGGVGFNLGFRLVRTMR